MAQFVGYHIDGYDTDKSIPVSTGATRDEALTKALRRVLSARILDGFVGAQEKPELTAEEFAQLTKIVDDHAEKYGLAS